MKIGVLTSSRADFGIYLPLLKKIKQDSFFELEIIAFGTHLSKFHGYTLYEIEKEGFSKVHKVCSLVVNDDMQAIASAYGLTALKFADFWAYNSYDLVLCLGDRFEMSAAIQAAIPFGINFAHLHGGECTLGAIDNIFRHQITLASSIHFTSTESYKSKVAQLIDSDVDIYSVGALSIDNISSYEIIAKDIFLDYYKIPNRDFALVTFQPETLANDNEFLAEEMEKALSKIVQVINLVITMPNADTHGVLYRQKKENIKNRYPDKVVIVENFGKKNYFAAMRHAKILIGNTSSGIIEAASFEKYVVNVGDRQKGRAQSPNIINSLFKEEDIIQNTKIALGLGRFSGDNIYYKSNVADNIIGILKSKYEKL